MKSPAAQGLRRRKYPSHCAASRLRLRSRRVKHPSSRRSMECQRDVSVIREKSVLERQGTPGRPLGCWSISPARISARSEFSAGLHLRYTPAPTESERHRTRPVHRVVNTCIRTYRSSKAFRSSKHASLGEQTMEASMRQAGGLISISLIRACMPINADRPCCVISGCFATCYIGRRIAETFNYTGHSALVNKN